MMRKSDVIAIVFPLLFILSATSIISSCASNTEEQNDEVAAAPESLPATQPKATPAPEAKPAPQSESRPKPEEQPQPEAKKEPQPHPPRPQPEAKNEPQPQQPEPEAQEESGPQPAEQPQQPPPPEEQPEQQPEEQVQAENGFAVSEKVYTETFEDIRTLIAELNTVIQAEDYETWLTYLTDDYVTHFSNPDVLRDASNQPLLLRYNIRLRSLKDYFSYVVVPSRSNARLDDLVFVDPDNVKAIMIIKEQRTILYQLVRQEGRWKIGL